MNLSVLHLIGTEKVKRGESTLSDFIIVRNRLVNPGCNSLIFVDGKGTINNECEIAYIDRDTV